MSVLYKSLCIILLCSKLVGLHTIYMSTNVCVKYENCQCNTIKIYKLHFGVPLSEFHCGCLTFVFCTFFDRSLLDIIELKTGMLFILIQLSLHISGKCMNSSEFSVQGKVFHCNLSHQCCSSAQRQVLHCKFRKQGCSYRRDE